MDKKNIIFMDGEFAKHKPDGINLISIGLVKPNGEELYLEIDFKGEIDSWVKENVIKHFKGGKVSKTEAQKKIREFVGNSKPYLVSYLTPFDWMGICNLFDVKNHDDRKKKLPFYWAPVDFTTFLFERDVAPGYSKIKLAKQYNIDITDITLHNALDDAKLLKRLYDKIINKHEH